MAGDSWNPRANELVPGQVRIAPMILALLLALPAAQSEAAAEELRAIKAATARNLLFIPVRLGDLPERPFVLDTGASAMVVNSRLAREAELAPGPAIHSGSAGDDRCPLAAVQVTATAETRGWFDAYPLRHRH